MKTAQLDSLKNRLEGLPVEISGCRYEKTGYHARIFAAADTLRDAVMVLYDAGFCLVFTTAVDATPSMQVIYEFAHFDEPCRVQLKSLVRPDNTIPTISDIYHGSDWYEREVRDFFGIEFDNHPNMTPLILMDEDRDFHPLRKTEAAVKSAGEISWATETSDKPDETKAE